LFKDKVKAVFAKTKQILKGKGKGIAYLGVAASTFAIASGTVVGVPVVEAAYSLALNFSVDSMFTYAQIMIDALLPVVYITLGISLGFIIIRALKSAFS
jgi:hypothetical protein